MTLWYLPNEVSIHDVKERFAILTSFERERKEVTGQQYLILAQRYSWTLSKLVISTNLLSPELSRKILWYVVKHLAELEYCSSATSRSFIENGRIDTRVYYSRVHVRT